MYKRKTKDYWIIEVRYTGNKDWDTVSIEETAEDARQAFRDYYDNVQCYGQGIVRRTKKRVAI